MYPGGFISGIIYLFENGWAYIRGGLKTGGLKVGFYGLSLEAARGIKLTIPSIFLALNFFCLTNYQKLWYNCSLFVNTAFDLIK